MLLFIHDSSLFHTHIHTNTHTHADMMVDPSLMNNAYKTASASAVSLGGAKHYDRSGGVGGSLGHLQGAGGGGNHHRPKSCEAPTIK